MNKRRLFPISIIFFTCIISVFAQTPVNEKIDRGVVALTIDRNHAYIGWRFLRTDPPDVSFNVYRKQVGSGDFQKVNNERNSSATNFIDETVKPGNAYRYRIRTVIDGNEAETPGEATIFMLINNQPYYSVMLITDARLKRLGVGDLIIGTFALDHDGKPIWYTGLKHNDAGYLADIDPSRPGMEIFYGIESRSPKNGSALSMLHFIYTSVKTP